AMGAIDNFFKTGNATEEMKVHLKTAYAEVKGDSGFEEYLAALESKAESELISDLKKEMIEEPAPQFTLTDVDGKEVSLADYKGKAVIVDFWATWCGPCLNSFPGMKKAVEKFSDDENVHFLFVNTWENVDDKVKNAKDFITNNNYPFHVLMDTENKVVTDFKVSGIPTKFIIDGNGNIRFKSVGFGGNTDHLVDELSAMISMIN
ncbi:MAG: TlpA family protein disulfide reductase, partial [Melioribacteraceae bacterium]|nr:TlpA family protein disulfide reductase [Melioribacteraceae bacterium]